MSPLLTSRFYIADSVSAKQYYDELQRQLQREWPEIQPSDLDGNTTPEPLVALTDANILAGGLAFVAAKSPLNDEPAVWINAVLVAPEYRRQGVASQLIVAAERAASLVGVSSLYALTEVPDLYSKLNWSILRNDGPDFVMALNIDRAASEQPR